NTPSVNAQQSGAWTVNVANAPAPSITTSGRAVILAGQSFANATMAMPPCPAGQDFLVTALHAGPEILIGATSINVVTLGNWGVSVPIYQLSSGGSQQVALTVLGSGPQHLSASIPGGKSASFGTQ